MRQAVLINNLAQEYSSNLFSGAENDVTIVSGGSNATITKDNTFKFSQLKSTKVDFINSASSVNFNINNVSITARKSGRHCFSIRFYKSNPSASVSFFAKVFVNGILTTSNTLEYDVYLSGGFNSDVWNCYSQNIELSINDIVTFSFEAQTDDSDCVLWIDGIKFEELSYPTTYTLPFDVETAWESKSDTTNIVSLTGGVNNLFSLTATSESNGGLVFLDNNSKIIPLKLGDSLIVDLAFTIETPSGSNNYIEVLFIVNTFVYGSQTFNLLKGSGNDDFIRISFGLPVSEDFFLNGGEFYIKPNVNLNIKNRYISVTRTHKGI